MLADRSLIWPSPERPCQSLTNTGENAAANHWTEHMVPNGGDRERAKFAEGVCSPIGRTTQIPLKLPGTRPSTKGYT